MRFARLKEDTGTPTAVNEGLTNRLILTIYNLVWWLPIVLTLTKVIGFRAGSISFLAVTAVRAVANLIRNNVLKVEQAQVFPLRAP